MWAIAIVVVLSPLMGLLLFLYFSPACRRILKEYQTLTGSLVALVSAGIALFGVLIAVDNQRQDLDRRLAAERLAAERQSSIKRQQIAGAFIGEINMILATLSDQRLYNRIENVIAQLRAAKGVTTTMDIMLRRPGKQLDTFYRSNTVEVGQFKAPLPELLTRFYGDYAVFEDIGWQVDRIRETGFKDTTASILEETLQNELDTLGQLRQVGETLIPHLEAVRDAPIP
jgi:hypothetical protein